DRSEAAATREDEGHRPVAAQQAGQPDTRFERTVAAAGLPTSREGRRGGGGSCFQLVSGSIDRNVRPIGAGIIQTRHLSDPQTSDFLEPSPSSKLLAKASALSCRWKHAGTSTSPQPDSRCGLWSSLPCGFSALVRCACGWSSLPT